MSSNRHIPEGWSKVPVSTLCSLIRGVSYKKGDIIFEPKVGYLPLLRANNIDSTLNFDDLKYVPDSHVSDKQILKLGDVIIAMSSGSKKVVGKTALYNHDCKGTFGAFCGVLRPNNIIDYKYFSYFFKTRYYRNKISNLVSGVNINNIRKEYFDDIFIPVSPKNEQKRIVKKVEELLSKVNITRERLNHVSVLLNNFRQAVLAAACSGKLTGEWRGENIHIVNNDFPENWESMQLDQLGEIVTGTTPSKKDPTNYNGTIPFFKPADLDKGYWVDESSDHLSTKGASLARILPKHSVMVTCIGATIGKVGFSRVKGATNQQINSIIISDENVSPFWLYWIISSSYMQEQIHQHASVTTLPILNKSRFSKLHIKAPPIEEQKEIVYRVETLFKLADIIETNVKSAQANCNKLTQSILAKAFKGELVPTEAELARKEGLEFETAEELLERVRNDYK